MNAYFILPIRVYYFESRQGKPTSVRFLGVFTLSFFLVLVLWALVLGVLVLWALVFVLVALVPLGLTSLLDGLWQ